jgi:hypothetical protein
MQQNAVQKEIAPAEMEVGQVVGQKAIIEQPAEKIVRRLDHVAQGFGYISNVEKANFTKSLFDIVVENAGTEIRNVKQP